MSYENFPIEKIELLPSLIEQNPDLVGLNVTIPYKQQVIPYMDELSVGAGDIGAVNTIVVHMSGKLSGHNSDIYGFDQSLNILIPETFRSGALILGTGGASKAVEYVCQRRGFPVTFVSRTPGEGQLAYQDVDEELLRQHRLIINTTPLGMHPHIEQCPVLPYELLDSGYYLFDLIYNPAVTQFLQRGKDQQSHIMNGMEMLIFQAEKSWQIWNENTSM